LFITKPRAELLQIMSTCALTFVYTWSRRGPASALAVRGLYLSSLKKSSQVGSSKAVKAQLVAYIAKASFLLSTAFQAVLIRGKC